MFAWIWFLLLNVGLWLMVPMAYSANATLSKKPDSVPLTTITSRTMTVSNQENKAVFDGSVVLTRGPLVVYSDHMVVSFHSSGNGKNGRSSADTTKRISGTSKQDLQEGKAASPTVSDRSIRKVEATGRVRIEKEGGRATCQKAEYYEEEKKIILTGDPVAWQSGTRVSGKRITMFLEEDRSVVEGNSQVTIEGEAGDRR